MNTKRVALYIRVSTEEQAREGYSLMTQREFLERYVKQQGWTVYYPKPGAIYEDDGFSGALLNRPALQRLLADAKLKKFDLVLVYKLDRFTRKLQDLENITEELQDLGIGFKSATEEFDTSTSTGKLQCQLLGVFAEFERKRIAERIFPGMVRCIQEGYWHGARYAPYGYRYNKKERQLEVVPAEAEVVKLMYAMYLEGQSTRQIAGYLYRKGYKTRSGGLFHTHLVGTILKNAIYTGKLAWNKKHYDKQQKTPSGKPRYVKNPTDVHVIAQGRHQAIIPEEEFRQVQERLAMQRKNRVVRAHAREYPLSGIIICGKCDHRYLGTLAVATRKTGEKRRYYRCSAPSTHDIPCKNVAVRADVLEAQIFRLLDLMMEHESAKNGRLETLIKAEARFQDETLDQQHKDIKAKLKDNLEKQGKLADAYLEGTMAKKVYVERAELLREQEADIRRELSKIELELVERERSEQYQHLLAAVVSSTDWETTKIDIFRKRQLLKLLFKRIVVTNGEITDAQFYKPFQGMYDEVVTRRKTSTKQELEEVCKGVCIWRPMDAK